MDILYALLYELPGGVSGVRWIENATEDDANTEAVMYIAEHPGDKVVLLSVTGSSVPEMKRALLNTMPTVGEDGDSLWKRDRD
jgi:hypothetical protein